MSPDGAVVGACGYRPPEAGEAKITKQKILRYMRCLTHKHKYLLIGPCLLKKMIEKDWQNIYTQTIAWWPPTG